jgi:hypothetical protein
LPACVARNAATDVARFVIPVCRQRRTGLRTWWSDDIAVNQGKVVGNDALVYLAGSTMTANTIAPRRTVRLEPLSRSWDSGNVCGTRVQAGGAAVPVETGDRVVTRPTSSAADAIVERRLIVGTSSPSLA